MCVGWCGLAVGCFTCVPVVEVAAVVSCVGVGSLVTCAMCRGGVAFLLARLRAIVVAV